MSETQLQKTDRTALKEKGQYLLAFSVVASVLWIVGFPSFVIFFFGIFAYFLLRMFSSGSRGETREIFEFYLTANEMLRDDERRWYGFEINEVIGRGEDIVRRMQTAPPLVHFSLGALHNKTGNHKAAVTNLAYVLENSAADEASCVSASPELQSYVRVLRKIEREPTDAPLTSAAVRALERARRLRGRSLLEESRQRFAAIPASVEQAMDPGEAHENDFSYISAEATLKNDLYSDARSRSSDSSQKGIRSVTARQDSTADPFVDRQSISELLHDIYDKKAQ